MTEIKTLKDLKEGCGQCNGTCERCQDGMRTDEELDKAGIFCINPKVDYAKARAEAIKWIKELEKDYGEYASDYPENIQDFVTYTGQDGDIPTVANVIAWIKHFFNITDEELK